MKFTDLGLDRELLRAIAAQGYSEPTPIQTKAIPVVLDGHDVMGRAQTGTGKTAAFTLPLLQLLSEDDEPLYKGRAPRALVLTPTRELAAQVEESVATYGAHLDLTSTVIFGGVGINPQKAALRRGVDILVATPGRLLDHAGQGSVDLSEIEILVLDEADRMLDMGFIHDIRRVLKLLPRDRQNLLFSATFSQEIQKLAASFLHQPRKVQVKAHRTAAETVEQCVYRVEKAEKRHLLAHLVREGGWQQVLVFTRTKHGANRLAAQLERAGIGAAAIHGNKSQGARTRALQGFKDGTVRVLVATDIAARGLDIDRLPHVVNFELPNVPEDYVHRIGRTGRAGEEGVAMSLVSSDEGKLLRAIEHLLGHRLPEEQLPTFDKPAPQPQQRRDAPQRDGEPSRRRRRRPRRPAGAKADGRGEQKPSRPRRPSAPSEGGSAAPKPRRRRRRRRPPAA
ncbi:MAG: DEAD/DEAH box helicase [Acidobacteriota bacterium]